MKKNTPESIADEARLCQKYIRERRRYIAERIDERLLNYLEERFSCNLPAFQRTASGGYDPLDAMRRDAYREVILWLQRERNLYLKTNN